VKKILLILFLLPLSDLNPRSHTSVQPGVRHVYGLSITHSANSQPVTLAILSMNGKTISRVQMLTWSQFVLQASGYAFSMAKTDTVNLFKKHGVKFCEPLYDSVRRRFFDTYCPALYEIWKLRYIRDPFHADERQNTGWAKSWYNPSSGQIKMLQDTFGITNITDYFIDDKLFLLLKKVQDTSFINLYKKQ
jgi:hypothetical protein